MRFLISTAIATLALIPVSAEAQGCWKAGRYVENCGGSSTRPRDERPLPRAERPQTDSYGGAEPRYPGNSRPNRRPDIVYDEPRRPRRPDVVYVPRPRYPDVTYDDRPRRGGGPYFPPSGSSKRGSSKGDWQSGSSKSDWDKSGGYGGR